MTSCRKCGAKNPGDASFCRGCGGNLNVDAPYWLKFEEFAHPQDVSNLEMLRDVEPIPTLINSAVNSFHKALTRGRVLRGAVEASEKDHRRLFNLVLECGERLCVRSLPRVFIVPSPSLNAFTVGGRDRPVIILHSALLGSLGVEEVTAVLGHEMGHVKGDHQPLHTVAYLLANGINFFSRLPLLSLPIELGLKSWHRYSELTADRASLLVVNDLEVIKKVQRSITRGEAFSSTAPGLERWGRLVELWRTHPFTENRLRELESYHSSKAYRRALEKMALAKVMRCPHCHGRVSSETVFCPNCRKALA